MSAGSSAGSGGGSGTKAWVRALSLTAPIAGQRERLLPDVIEDLGRRFGDAPALLSDEDNLSFRGLAARMNKYARLALAEGLGRGDTVCLLMPNCPDYLAIWLGIIRAGGVVALLNTNLTGRALAHGIDLVRPRHIIVAAAFEPAFASALPFLEHRPKIWLHGGGTTNAPRIDRIVAEMSGADFMPKERPALTLDDRALNIYTSGTTGLPKAVHINHYRLMVWSHWFAGMMDTGPNDRLYNCLPMYHSIGGTVAPGAVLVNGGAVVLREKFSRGAFWNDVVRMECTLVQYIGELCRYLLNAPPHPLERSHKIRLFCGNGLRPDVWTPFQDRFAIPQILEFYAATEGSFSLFNVEGRPGAVGRIPPFLQHRFPTALVKFDIETNLPVRDALGFCIPCAVGEPGEALGRILETSVSLGGRFEGYTDHAASERKILRDVFAPGDAWYRTGDLMRKDEKGFWYFVDRIGDTFRWKGENVSTLEVAETLAAFPGIHEVTVYGVAIPGADGRAGMAAIVAEKTLDLAAFRRHIEAALPPYAQPLFLRLPAEIETTATFKQRKADLAREGFDPALPDPVYFNDRAAGAFMRLDAGLHARILAGDIRL